MKKLPNLRRELRRARHYIKMFIPIPGPCVIGFQCSNMRIEGNNASSDMELKNQDFETQIDRLEEITKFKEGVRKSGSVN